MKTIVLSQGLFGDVINDDDTRFNSKRKKESSNNHLEASVPDSLDQKCLERYLFHYKFTNRSFSPFQLDALLELLGKADSFGHNINELLTVATASNWSRVVFDNHLKPLDKSS